MNILLINPWIYDFAAFDLWVKPLGLLYIGSFLEPFGYKVSLIDCIDRFHPAIQNATKTKKYATGKFYAEEIEKPLVIKDIPRKFKRHGIPLKVFERELEKKSSPDLVIVTSMMSYWYPGVFEAINQVKQIFPNVPIVLGGIYATVCTAHAKKYSGADHVITGEGKIDVLKIADSVSGKTRNYKKVITDLDALPYPAYHLYNTVTAISMLTSLGCPHACTYCASRIIQPVFIERNPQKVFKEICHYVHTFHINNIAFYDDALLIHAEKRFLPLAKKIIDEKLPVQFHTPNGLNIRSITDEVAVFLYRAQFKTIRLSFESATSRIQHSSSQKATNEELVWAKKNLLKAGYRNEEIEVYVMVGLPAQNKEEVIDSIRFVHHLGLMVKLVQYSPIPHTKDYATVVKQYPFIDTEPLLHNNSVYSLKTDEIGYASLTEIKKLVKDLNGKITATTE
ncbi:MAG: cobalamin-dependent protein [Candidatus Omnitrophica bacterium]|nr:cobalamin-dependent protein [Candidatus Omnitrophota bacterium]